MLTLSVAPLNRTLEAWFNETIEHTWPSFRGEEALTENLVVDPANGINGYTLAGINGTLGRGGKGGRWLNGGVRLFICVYELVNSV